MSRSCRNSITGIIKRIVIVDTIEQNTIHESQERHEIDKNNPEMTVI